MSCKIRLVHGSMDKIRLGDNMKPSIIAKVVLESSHSCNCKDNPVPYVKPIQANIARYCQIAHSDNKRQNVRFRRQILKFQPVSLLFQRVSNFFFS